MVPVTNFMRQNMKDSRELDTTLTQKSQQWKSTEGRLSQHLRHLSTMLSACKDFMETTKLLNHHGSTLLKEWNGAHGMLSEEWTDSKQEKNLFHMQLKSWSNTVSQLSIQTKLELTPNTWNAFLRSYQQVKAKSKLKLSHMPLRSKRNSISKKQKRQSQSTSSIMSIDPTISPKVDYST